MRIGIMYADRGRAGPVGAIKGALAQWQVATHTNGFEPLEARFNPGELPDEPLLCGLVVLEDEQVPAGHVRLTTTDLTIESEWSITLDAVRDEVEVSAA